MLCRPAPVRWAAPVRPTRINRDWATSASAATASAVIPRHRRLPGRPHRDPAGASPVRSGHGCFARARARHAGRRGSRPRRGRRLPSTRRARYRRPPRQSTAAKSTAFTRNAWPLLRQRLQEASGAPSLAAGTASDRGRRWRTCRLAPRRRGSRRRRRSAARLEVRSERLGEEGTGRQAPGRCVRGRSSALSRVAGTERCQIDQRDDRSVLVVQRLDDLLHGLGSVEIETARRRSRPPPPPRTARRRSAPRADFDGPGVPPAGTPAPAWSSTMTTTPPGEFGRRQSSGVGVQLSVNRPILESAGRSKGRTRLLGCRR